MSENNCSHCGATNAPQAKFCQVCGKPLAAFTPPPPGPSSNKALISLILGILSVFCCGPFSGVPGAIVGKMEMDAIKQGRAPQSNMGMAKAGFWISIVGTALSIVILILSLLMGFLQKMTTM